jgi:hypothetical protein
VARPSATCWTARCCSSWKASRRESSAPEKRCRNRGGDVSHYSDGNNRDYIKCRFVVTMICDPGQPMLVLVDEEELAVRAHLRAPAESSTSA